ncbi:MAG: hypothetical protein KKH08_04105 [Candidatus Omnitrophica bacterium]|nr:hypothetical protein [Candidatus Omnitrophota bacterium]
MDEDKKQRVKWYFRTASLVWAFLFVGPLALPLVWINPNLSVNKKWIITLAVIILSYFLWIFAANSLESLKEYYKLVL